jgi:uncharacterized membrane protein YheB (UPF0754 family)
MRNKIRKIIEQSELHYTARKIFDEESFDEMIDELVDELSNSLEKQSTVETNVKTAKITLESIKASDGWMSIAYELKFDQFKNEHPELDEDELSDKFHTEVVYKKFQYGEFANIELIVDENFNIVGGKIL